MLGWLDRSNKDRVAKMFMSLLAISEFQNIDLNDYKSVVGLSIVTIHSKKQSISQTVDHSANKSTN